MPMSSSSSSHCALPGTPGPWRLQPHFLSLLLLSQLGHTGYNQLVSGCWWEYTGKAILGWGERMGYSAWVAEESGGTGVYPNSIYVSEDGMGEGIMKRRVRQ